MVSLLKTPCRYDGNPEKLNPKIAGKVIFSRNLHFSSKAATEQQFSVLLPTLHGPVILLLKEFE